MIHCPSWMPPTSVWLTIWLPPVSHWLAVQYISALNIIHSVSYTHLTLPTSDLV